MCVCVSQDRSRTITEVRLGDDKSLLKSIQLMKIETGVSVEMQLRLVDLLADRNMEERVLILLGR